MRLIVKSVGSRNAIDWYIKWHLPMKTISISGYWLTLLYNKLNVVASANYYRSTFNSIFTIVHSRIELTVAHDGWTRKYRWCSHRVILWQRFTIRLCLFVVMCTREWIHYIVQQTDWIMNEWMNQINGFTLMKLNVDAWNDLS